MLISPIKKKKVALATTGMHLESKATTVRALVSHLCSHLAHTESQSSPTLCKNIQRAIRLTQDKHIKDMADKTKESTPRTTVTTLTGTKGMVSTPMVFIT